MQHQAELELRVSENEDEQPTPTPGHQERSKSLVSGEAASIIPTKPARMRTAPQDTGHQNRARADPANGKQLCLLSSCPVHGPCM